MRLPIFMLPALFIAASVTAQTADKPAIDLVGERSAAEAGSLFDAFYSNMLAWEQGDLLLKVTDFSDSGEYTKPGEEFVMVESAAFHRIVFDHPRNHYFYAVVSTTEISVFESPTGETGGLDSNRRMIKGFVINDDGKFARVLPNGTVELRKSVSQVDVFRQYGVPDLRTVGIFTFGKIVAADKLKNAIDRLASGHGISQIKMIDPKTQRIVYKWPNAKRTDETSITTYDLDTELFIPLQRRIELELKGSRNQKGLLSSEKFKWRDLDGVQVPVSVRRQFYSTKKVNGKKYYFKTLRDADVHWFSLNEPIEDSLLRLENLNDLNHMLRLVDPTAAKATTLIPEKRDD